MQIAAMFAFDAQSDRTPKPIQNLPSSTVGG